MYATCIDCECVNIFICIDGSPLRRVAYSAAIVGGDVWYGLLGDLWRRTRAAELESLLLDADGIYNTDQYKFHNISPNFSSRLDEYINIISIYMYT